MTCLHTVSRGLSRLSRKRLTMLLAMGAVICRFLCEVKQFLLYDPMRSSPATQYAPAAPHAPRDAYGGTCLPHRLARLYTAPQPREELSLAPASQDCS